MKKQLLITATLLLSLVGFAQTSRVEFTYDAAGNRIQRKVVTFERPQAPPTASVVEEPPIAPTVEAETVRDHSARFTYNLFPNPTSGVLNISTTQEIGAEERFSFRFIP